GHERGALLGSLRGGGEGLLVLVVLVEPPRAPEHRHDHGHGDDGGERGRALLEKVEIVTGARGFELLAQAGREACTTGRRLLWRFGLGTFVFTLVHGESSGKRLPLPGAETPGSIPARQYATNAGRNGGGAPEPGTGG